MLLMTLDKMQSRFRTKIESSLSTCKIAGAETTHGNVAAFANEVQKNLNK